MNFNKQIQTERYCELCKQYFLKNFPENLIFSCNKCGKTVCAECCDVINDFNTICKLCMDE